jgi:branched-subunit amino acid aminotransferase/4-amino-4-deoxychorismate lyase
MENNRWVIYDKKLIRASEPAVPVESRGLMYGEGCFETLRAYKGAFYKPEEHLDRLKQAAAFLGFSYPEDLQLSSFRELSGKLLNRNNLLKEDAVIRIQLWGSGGRGYRKESSPEVHYSILADPLPDFASEVTLATVDTRRIPSESMPSAFKLTNNINYIAAARQAAKKRADDALMLTVDETVSETTIANVFWLAGNTVYTPSEECDLLPGITRKTVLEILSTFSSYDIKKGRFTLKDIKRAEAVWICNSLRHIIGVSGIDDHGFDPGHDFLHRIQNAYDSHVKSELS